MPSILGVVTQSWQAGKRCLPRVPDGGSRNRIAEGARTNVTKVGTCQNPAVQNNKCAGFCHFRANPDYGTYAFVESCWVLLRATIPLRRRALLEKMRKGTLASERESFFQLSTSSPTARRRECRAICFVSENAITHFHPQTADATNRPSGTFLFEKVLKE